MFGIGPTEFIIIGVVALMLFSPRELPKMLRSAAKFWASLRNTADEFRDAIMNEEELQDIRGVLKGGVSDIKRAEAAARRELMKARMEMQKAQSKLLKTVKAAEDAKRQELADGGDTAAAAAINPAANPGAPAAGETDAAATDPARPVDGTTPVTRPVAAEPAAAEPPAPAPAGAVPAAPPGRGAA